MKFEYDPKKSQANLTKHGIDFATAQALWEGLSLEFTARSEIENRFAIIGPIENKLYTCIFTIRDECIRIISCRRSREKEAKLYEKTIAEA
jgi:uncharacterized DUF497 family protein